MSIIHNAIKKVVSIPAIAKAFGADDPLQKYRNSPAMQFIRQSGAVEMPVVLIPRGGRKKDWHVHVAVPPGSTVRGTPERTLKFTHATPDVSAERGFGLYWVEADDKNVAFYRPYAILDSDAHPAEAVIFETGEYRVPSSGELFRMPGLGAGYDFVYRSVINASCNGSIIRDLGLSPEGFCILQYRTLEEQDADGLADSDFLFD